MLLLAVLATLTAHVLLLRWLRQLESMRIATDGQRIAVRLGKRTFKVPAQQATCTRQHLLLGRHMVPLRLNGSPLFDETALRRDILARLPQLRVLDGQFDLGWLRHMLRHGGWRGQMIAVVLMATVLLGSTLLAAKLMGWVN